MRRIAGAAWLLASMMVTLPVRAAELRFDPPQDCSVTRESIEAQVEHLVGRPLASVAAGEFEVRVRRTGGQWRLTLRSRPAPGSGDTAVHARQISGPSCAEVTDAAAVAIALAIEGREPPPDAAEPWDEVPADEALDAEPPAAAAQPATASPPVAAAAKEAKPQPDDSTSPPLRFGLGAGLLLDGGALPALAAGGSLELLAEWSALRLELLGALFFPQRTELADGRGGEFDLALGAVHACGQSAFGDLHVIGCAGFELGQLSGRGLRVRTEHPRDTGWRAIGVEAGVVWTVLPRLGVLVRAGVVRPLSRPEFVLDGTEAVHRAAAFGFRAVLGVETYL